MRTLVRAISVLALTCVAAGAHAREGGLDQKAKFSIAAQSLSSALLQFAKQSRIQVLTESEDLEGYKTRGVEGELTSNAALEAILAGTGLSYRMIGTGTVTIRKGEQVFDRDAGRFGDTVNMVLAQQDQKASQEKIEGQPRKEEAAAQKQRDQDIEEVIVTAQKRVEKLQDIPFALSALTTADLERTGATSAEDYLALVPGAHYNSFGRGRSRIVMRGVATEPTPYSNLQPTVERFLDELPLSDRFSPWTESDPDTFDMARVEVLRGPQNLYGSGALGGVIRLISNKPDLTAYQAKLEAGMAATKDGDNSNSLNAMVNAPLIQDKLALRVVGWRKRDGGYIDDIRNGTDNYNDGLVKGVRAMLAYQPTDATHARFTVYYGKDTLNGSASSFRFAADGQSYGWDPVQPESSSLKLQMHNLTVEHDFGPVALTSTTTYGLRDSHLVNDWVPIFTGGPAGVGQDNETTISHDSKRFVQELRLASTGEAPLQWNVGGSVYDYKLKAYQIWDVGVPSTTLLDQISDAKVTEYAVFGEATYHFNERWSVTAGGREFYSDFSIQVIPVTASPFNSPGSEEAINKSFSPKFSVSYYPQDDIHLYATAARGYRIGQNNTSGLYPQIPPGSDPDSLWNYELGVKSTWLEQRLLANVAVYYIDWSDIQLTKSLLDAAGNALPFSAHLANGGEAQIKGIEAELTFRPVDAVRIGTSMAYADAELASVDPGVELTPGSRLPGTPKFNATSYAQYESQITGAVDSYVRLTHRYVSEVEQSIQNGNPLNLTGAYHAFDLRTGINYERYEFALYINNLTNNDAIVLAGGVGFGGFGYENSPVVRLRPRTVGLTFRAAF